MTEQEREERINEIRAELYRLYKNADDTLKPPDWREVDPLHHELTELIKQREEVVDGKN